MRRQLGLIFIVCFSCRTTETPAPAPPPPAPVQAAPVQTPVVHKPLPPGVDAAAMDDSVEPCADFYRYACGGWLKNTPIPPDRDRYSHGFIALTESNEKILRQILDDAVAGRLPEGTLYAKQLADFYSSCMDEEALEK